MVLAGLAGDGCCGGAGGRLLSWWRSLRPTCQVDGAGGRPVSGARSSEVFSAAFQSAPDRVR
eukprot:26286-Chlamydomonas_euryale.AAC.1